MSTEQARDTGMDSHRSFSGDISAAQRLWCAGQWLELKQPKIMGVLNVTPDSFSDGGRYRSPSFPSQSDFRISLDRALASAEQMIRDGAALIDVGGESTRPGAEPVSEQEELDRVVPVVEAISKQLGALVSVDTSTAAVIREAARAGAGMINDVRALQRPGALGAVADSDMAVCLMHMQGQPESMQDAPLYDSVTDEVIGFLEGRVAACVEAGIAAERICLDPGFGFGKTVAHNYELLSALPGIKQLGLPLLIGLSRKSMIGAVTGRDVSERLAGSLSGASLAMWLGADIIRVHDVAATVDCAKVVTALRENAVSFNPI
ncbi:dihydropteroate synthase [Pseudohongiella nitratireducens]|uniref:Dihydropteroate synthase n=2 Tax=Pseudohongiella nitratireducens TaxID=1768907 RepID=A0A916QKA6_9GAMM|nr:dihydropteroate synthase [Pseudohongiella nitratireducens]